METGAPAFCQRCGARLTRRDVQGAQRPFCASCGFVHFFDPKVAVVALVEDPEGRLLYTKRNHEPKLGAWAWPGGWVDRGEVVEEAVAREVKEETGLDVALDGLIGVFSQAGQPAVLVAYRAHAAGGRLAPGPEAEAVRFFALDQIPPSAFPLDAEILAAWRACPAPFR